MVKSVVLDFDGVIVDSNRLKREAFFGLFPRTERVAALVSGALSRSQGKSRFEILRDVLRAMGEPDGAMESLVARFADEYNRKVQQGIAELGLMAGVKAALEALGRQYRLYLNSGTYGPALRESVARLEIGHFFREIRGGPAGKADNLKEIMVAGNTGGGETLVIGDSEEDYQSSVTCGCWFIGVANGFNGWREQSFPLVADLSSAVSLIESLGSDSPHGRGEGKDHRRGIHW